MKRSGSPPSRVKLNRLTMDRYDQSPTFHSRYVPPSHRDECSLAVIPRERSFASHYQPPVTERRRAPTVDPHARYLQIHREYRPPNTPLHPSHHHYVSPHTIRHSPPYESNYLHQVRPEDLQATRTLYVGNLEVDISEEELRRIFGKFGQLGYINIKRPPLRARKAFAFVHFENSDMANRAKFNLSGQYIGKFQCKIGYGRANPPTRNRPPAAPELNFVHRELSKYDGYVSCGGRGLYRGRGSGRGAFSRGDYQLYEPQRIIDEEERRHPLPALEYEPGKNRTYEPVVNNRTQRAQSRVHSRGPHTPDSEPDDNMSPGELLGSAATLSDVARKAVAQWSGALVLKSSQFLSKLYLTDGDQGIATILMKDENGLPNLRITQRLRMNQSKLNDVESKLNNVVERIRTSKSHAIFLALSDPGSSNSPDNNVQTRPLRNLVSYLKHKDAAGVSPLLQKTLLSSGVLYAFPPCQFSADLLRRTCHNLTDETLKEDYLVIVVVCGVNAVQV